MADRTMDPLIEGYLSYLGEIRRLSPRSLVDMRCTFNKANESLAAMGQQSELWKLTLEDYFRWIALEREKGKSSQTIAKQISHIRGLLDYAWRNNRADRNVLEGFNLQDVNRKVPPRVLSVDEARRLVEACGTKTALDRRRRTMILLLYGCGLRTNELCQLDLGDVNREKQEILVRQAKGDIQRWIPVPDGVWTEVLAYLSERKGVRGPLLKTEAKNKRIREIDVLEAVREAVKKAGLEGEITPRTLRHTFATHLMDAGVDLAVISSLMGHRSPRETGVYLHSLPGRKEKAVGGLKVFQNEKEVEL
jgi:site-specific recombinase XerD